MGIDISKMRAKLAALNNKGGNGNLFWKPQDGEQTIRIVTPADGDPFKDYWFHYNLGTNRGFLSPKKNFGEADPLDDFIRNLFNEGTEDSIKMAKNLMARQRFFAPVLVRGEENKGIRIWGFGKLAYQQLLELVLNPEYGDITDVDEGTDLVIKYGKMGGESFPKTTITPRRRTSPLCDEAVGGSDRCRELLDNIPDFNGLFERKTPEEVGKMLDEWLEGGDPEESGSESEKYNTKSSDDVQKAFDDLLQQSA
tara:strand:+ start:196 stop:954 length:759 start_codon:yes stop_codon:yes gene_type:complete